MAGGLKFHTVKYRNNTVICTVNDKSSPSQVTGKTRLLLLETFIPRSFKPFKMVMNMILL